MRSNYLRKLAFASMFCALTFAATWISFPSPVAGSINLGDGVLLIAVFSLGGPWSVIACAVGAALTDVLSGVYAVYAPATLLIKALMALAALGIRRLFRRLPLILRVVFAGIASGCVMIAGYLCYEAFFLSYGAAALANVPFNAVQAAVTVIVASFGVPLLHHSGVSRYFNE